MINIIKKNGVRKSAIDVIKGIKKLLGSFPFLKIIIELINKDTNIIKNNNNIVIIKMIAIKNGLNILTPIINAML